MEDITIRVELNHSEALVLFEWLARCGENGKFEIAHSAEQKVLWRIEGQLERTLREPLDPNYDVLLESARKNVDAE